MNDQMAEFRARLDILAIAEKAGAEIRPTGGGRAFIICPFVAEKTPSCMLYPDDNHFYCHGHQERGSAIDLVAALKNLSVGEAIDWIAETFNIPRPERNPEQAAWSATRRRLREALADGLESAAPESLPAGLTPELAATIGLGLAVGLAAVCADLPKPALTDDEIIDWEGAWTLELHARGGLVGFGAFTPDGFEPQASLRVPAFGGLSAARETMNRHHALVCVLEPDDLGLVLASGATGVVCPARTLDAEGAAALADLAAHIVLAVRAPLARSEALVGPACALLGAGARPILRAISDDGSLSAPVPIFAFLARWASTLPAAERLVLLHRAVQSVSSPTARHLTRAWLETRGLLAPDPAIATETPPDDVASGGPEYADDEYGAEYADDSSYDG